MNRERIQRIAHFNQYYLLKWLVQRYCHFNVKEVLITMNSMLQNEVVTKIFIN
jgi:hypothetical protein